MAVWWVTWPDISDNTQARNQAAIWGPEPNGWQPPTVAGQFEAGPFPSSAAAKAYKAAIGTNAVIPPPGTPIVGDVQSPANPLAPLGAIGDFFHRLTESETWVRVGEVGLGVIVIVAAFRGLTHGSTTIGSGARAKATSPIRKVARAGATVAAPELRYGARVAAKRVAPKTTARVAAHRTQVAKHEAKKPYQPPAPRQPIRHVVERRSTITHVKAEPKKLAQPLYSAKTGKIIGTKL